jgi:hypothetical protein
MRSGLPAIPGHFAFARFPLLPWSSGGLLRRQLQHGLNRGSSGHIHQLVAGYSALLDQIHHGHQVLPIPGKERAQLASVHPPLLSIV